jgi:hypothetical protein
MNLGPPLRRGPVKIQPVLKARSVFSILLLTRTRVPNVARLIRGVNAE